MNALVGGKAVAAPAESPSNVVRAREALRDAQEAERKAEEAKAAAQKAKDDAAALATAKARLRPASVEEPVDLRCVCLAGTVTFDPQSTQATNRIDLDNRTYAGTVLLFDGDMVHVIRPGVDAAKSFMIPKTAVLAMYPK